MIKIKFVKPTVWEQFKLFFKSFAISVTISYFVVSFILWILSMCI